MRINKINLNIPPQQCSSSNDIVFGQANTKAEKVDKTKKYIEIGAVLTTIGGLGVIVLKKGTKYLKYGFNQLVEKVTPTVKYKGNLLEPTVLTPKNYRESFTKHLVTTKQVPVKGCELSPSYNGAMVYGPSSRGKEKLFEELVQELADADYKIVRMPFGKEATVTEVDRAFYKAIEEAEAHYKATKQYTAIIVRDMNKLAPDRNINNPEIASSLFETNKCAQRGYVWLSEAKTLDGLDPAPIRGGRIEWKMPAKPLPDEPIDVWDEYIDIVKKFVRENHQQAFLDDAMATMAQK